MMGWEDGTTAADGLPIPTWLQLARHTSTHARADGTTSAPRALALLTPSGHAAPASCASPGYFTTQTLWSLVRSLTLVVGEVGVHDGLHAAPHHVAQHGAHVDQRPASHVRVELTGVACPLRTGRRRATLRVRAARVTQVGPMRLIMRDPSVYDSGGSGALEKEGMRRNELGAVREAVLTGPAGPRRRPGGCCCSCRRPWRPRWRSVGGKRCGGGQGAGRGQEMGRGGDC